MSEYNWTAGYPSRIPEKMPPKEFEMGKFHIVDLTKVLDPKTESRRCRLWRFNTGGSIPDFHTIMDLTSHLGTHCECPYHHDDNWASVAELPLTNFMGRGIYAVLDLPANHQITGADLEAAIGSRIRPGDTVILDSPHIALVLGAGLGLLAGYSGGFVSGLIMRMVDAQLSIPGLILTMCLVAIFGGSILSVSVIIGISSLPGYIRMIYGQVLSLRENDYVAAALLVGQNKWEIMVKHLFPNAFPTVIVMFTGSVGSAVMIESGLAYLGIGITPPTSAWGTMISEGYNYFMFKPILALVPGIALMLLIITLNIIGDGLRDALDPRLRGKL